MNNIGVGFIGAGDIASIHKAALLEVPGVRITAVYDVDEARAKRLGAEVGAKLCRSAEEVAHSPNVDVVYVLTPQPAHFEMAAIALDAGKHTFVEKPVSLRKQDISEMIRLAEKKGCLCVPGHNYIHSADLKTAKRLLDSGKLGELRALWILFMVGLPPEIRNRIPGPLREVMIHHFYSMLFLVGKPESVFAAVSDFSGRGEHNEDQAVVICRMPGGALATLFASFSAEDLTYDPWTLKYKLIGSAGSASHGWNSSRLSDRPQPVWDLPAYWETFREEDRYFIADCVRGSKQPLSTLHDALGALDILEAVESSVRTGSEQALQPVDLQDHEVHLVNPNRRAK